MARLLTACLFGIVVLASARLVWAGPASESGLEADASPAADFVMACDAGTILTPEERAELLATLGKSKYGAGLLADFERSYGSYANLLIQWDNVSYSQVVNVRRSGVVKAGRALASGSSPLGNGVCVHLTRKLPDIEHVADLAHELTHATRLSLAVLHGDVASVEEFVHARLAARGGEADAFASECRVKFELLHSWDELCSPYASSDDKFDTEMVVRDLYSGRMSASLTGETYPVMLSRQYRSMTAKRAVAKASRVSYSAGASYGQHDGQH